MIIVDIFASLMMEKLEKSRQKLPDKFIILFTGNKQKQLK